MVEDRVTDGKRVAQLLASELSGRADGPLADVAVVDADPDVDPTPAGAPAYRVAVDGVRVATVHVVPGAALLAVSGADGTVFDGDAAVARARAEGLPVRERDGRPVVRVPSGAAVKRALDAVVTGLETNGG